MRTRNKVTKKMIDKLNQYGYVIDDISKKIHDPSGEIISYYGPLDYDAVISIYAEIVLSRKGQNK